MGLLAMLLPQHLTATCTITARATTTTNADNQPVESFPTPVTGIACRLIDLTDKRIENGDEAGLGEYTDAILVPVGTVVAPFARVSAVVRTRDSVSIDPGPWTVLDVAQRETDGPEFLRLLLKRVN